MKKMNLALAAALLISMAACTNSPKKGCNYGSGNYSEQSQQLLIQPPLLS